MDKKQEVKLKLQNFRIGKIREASSKLELYSQLAEELGELMQVAHDQIATLTRYPNGDDLTEYNKKRLRDYGEGMIHALEEYTDIKVVVEAINFPDNIGLLDLPVYHDERDLDKWIHLAMMANTTQHACFKAMRYLSGGFVVGELADFEASIIGGIKLIDDITDGINLYKDSDLFGIKVARWYNRLCSIGRIAVNNIPEEEEGGDNDGAAQVSEESDQK